MRLRIISLFAAALAIAATAHAQTKISGSCRCSKPDKQYSIEVGDRTNHSVMISQAKCTWTKPLELEGVQNKEGVSTAYDDVTGNRSQTRGFYLDTMANGDKAHVRYQGTATLKDGVPQTMQGSWSYTRGTGKLKGLQGKGTYKGTGNADGSVTYEVEGEYQVPKK